MTRNDIEQIDPAAVAQFSPIHIEAVVRGLQRMLLRSMADTDRLDILRELCGYVEEGSHNHVTLSQADAPRKWIVAIGITQPHMKGCGKSLRDAIDSVGGGI